MEQPSQQPPKPWWSHRFIVGLGVGEKRLLISAISFVVFVLLGGLAWTFTPSYSLYHIQQALETHDYERFARYVDVDSVVGHAVDELGLKPPQHTGAVGGDSLADIVRQGLQVLSGELRGLVSAGASFVLEQAIRDRSRALPDIPTLAVLGAIFVGDTQDGVRHFPIPIQDGEQIEVSMRKSDEGVWRVVEVANVKGLLAQLKERYLDGRTEK